MAVSIIGPKFYAWDSYTGKPLAFGKVYTYQAGTNTPKATFTAEGGETQNSNPVILNGAGYADIYLNGSYKIVVKDADDVEVWTSDPVSDPSQLQQEWVQQKAATQYSATQFEVVGNHTGVYNPGRALKLQDSAVLYGVVTESVYIAGKTRVTAAIEGGTALTASLREAWVGIMSRSGEVSYPDIASFLKITPAANVPTVRITSFHGGWAPRTEAPNGGGFFSYDENRAKSDHNGGTIISPTVPWDGSQAGLADFLNGVGETDAGGTGCWVRSNDSEVWVEDFGAVGDGTADDWAAINAAVNRDFRGEGTIIYAGKVKLRDTGYYLSKTLNLKRIVHIEGMYGHIENTSGCRLIFAPDTRGVIVNRYNTIDDTVEATPSGRADGSKIIGVSVISQGGSDINAHGIWLRARAVVDNMRVHGFPGNGFQVVATARGSAPEQGNANNFSASNMRITGNGRHGFYVDGADVNAGFVLGIDCSGNGRSGIFDSSFLGNTYIGCHVGTNGVATAGNNAADQSSFVSYGGNRYAAHWTATEAQLVATEPGTDSSVWVLYGSGSTHRTIPLWEAGKPEGTYFQAFGYRADNDNARNVFLGCYWESGASGNAFDSGPTQVLGGSIGWVMVGDHLRSNSSGETTLNSLIAKLGGIETQLGGNPSNGDVLRWSHASESNTWRLKFVNGDYVLDFANIASVLTITGENTTERYRYRLKMSDIILGSGRTAKMFGRVYYSTAPGVVFPTSGDYLRGDIYVAPNPTAGDKIGWVCTTGGTAGSTAVFKAFGAIDA